MKVLNRQTGPFRERPYYSLQEIEEVCLESLRGNGLLPVEPGPVRVERFVEKHFGVTPQYEILPEGVLGYTAFSRSGVDAVVVAAQLDEDSSRASERRIRTTLAHEAGHGLLHTYLVALHFSGQNALFSEAGPGPEVLCRDVAGVSAAKRHYSGQWWEYQANRAIGALLMPRKLVNDSVACLVRERTAFGIIVIRERQRESLVRELSETFDVNPVVARIRLDELFPRGEESQLSL